MSLSVSFVSSSVYLHFYYLHFTYKQDVEKVAIFLHVAQPQAGKFGYIVVIVILFVFSK